MFFVEFIWNFSNLTKFRWVLVFVFAAADGNGDDDNDDDADDKGVPGHPSEYFGCKNESFPCTMYFRWTSTNELGCFASSNRFHMGAILHNIYQCNYEQDQANF